MSSKIYSSRSYYNKLRVDFKVDWNDLKPEVQSELISRCIRDFHATNIESKLVDVTITCTQKDP